MNVRAADLELERTTRIPRRHLAMFCGALLAALSLWMLLWPYTGEGDAVFHYLIARASLQYPENALSAFARPLHKLLLVFPAQAGVPAARLASALISMAAVWQTIRLAEDLDLRNSLLAGLFLLFQPLVFALAGDTMTELPAALMIVVAIRLWWRQRLLASSLVVSFVPLMRPEGFFLILLWALLLWLTRPRGPRWMWEILFPAALLGTGTLCWIVAGSIIMKDPMYFWRYFWPAQSYAAYGRGPIWWHLARWPDYCGPVLLALFLAGIRPSANRRMLLPWAVWLLVFVLHTVLYWRGWFASIGLMRIMATTSPITALVCLYGWNSLATWLQRREIRPLRRRRIGVAALLALVLTPMVYWLVNPARYHGFSVRRVGQFLREHRLHETAPVFFAGDRLVLAELDYPRHPAQVAENRWSRQEQLEALASLPVGAVGVWDNRQAAQWHSVNIEDLPDLGYTVLFEARQLAPDFGGRLIKGHPWWMTQRWVVIRKDR